MKYAILTATCSTLVMFVGAAAARDFTIAAWGGNYQDAQREAYFTPFAEAHGLKTVETTYLGGLAELKAMSDTGNVTWDLLMAGGTDAQLACDEGLLEEIDWDSVPNADKLIETAKFECAVGSVIIGNGLAYNAEMFPEAPTGWADYFDLAKYPGKRGMSKLPYINMEYALLGDGVPMDKVYEVLGTPEGLDRAFAKLDSIKPQLQFWEAGSQPVEWLVANNVVMSTAYNGRIITAKNEGKPLEFIWPGHVYNIDVWAIPKDAPFKDEALKFFEIANDPAAQAKFSSKMPYGPTNPEALPLIAPEAMANLPAGDNISAALFYDDAFWIENGQDIQERWTTWLNN